MIDDIAIEMIIQGDFPLPHTPEGKVSSSKMSQPQDRHCVTA